MRLLMLHNVLCTLYIEEQVVHSEVLYERLLAETQLLAAGCMVEVSRAKLRPNPKGEIWVLNNIAKRIATYFYLDLLFFILNKMHK